MMLFSDTVRFKRILCPTVVLVALGWPLWLSSFKLKTRYTFWSLSGWFWLLFRVGLGFFMIRVYAPMTPRVRFEF